MQKDPTVTFTHSLELESRRVIYLAGTISRNWFQKHSFLVLPRLLPKVATSQVIFPDLPYNTIPRFWSQVAHLKLTTPIEASPSLIDSVSQLILPSYSSKLYSKHLSKLEKQWRSIENSFWNKLFTLFPHYQNMLNYITIISTQYGPYTTFSLADKTHSRVAIYIRQDSTLDRLLWTILTCLFRPKMQYDMHYTWEEIEAVVDWIMSESSLACGLQLTNPTIKNLRAEQIALYHQESLAYLTRLGFTAHAHIVNKDGIYYFADQPINNLTLHDQLLLDLLLAKRPETASYEEIASTLWPTKTDWSLYAITKTIERLRFAIRANGITIPVVLAHRKLGYSLI